MSNKKGATRLKATPPPLFMTDLLPLTACFPTVIHWLQSETSTLEGSAYHTAGVRVVAVSSHAVRILHPHFIYCAVHLLFIHDLMTKLTS